jgi:hypothetical protein
MNVPVKAFLIVMLSAAISACGDGPEARQAIDLSGSWVGYAITGDGSQMDLRLTLSEGADGYSGTLQDVAENLPEMALRGIVVADNQFACEFDLPTDQGSDLIKITADYANETLSGSYVDPTGDSDRVFFRRAGGG